MAVLRAVMVGARIVAIWEDDAIPIRIAIHCESISALLPYQGMLKMEAESLTSNHSPTAVLIQSPVVDRTVVVEVHLQDVDVVCRRRIVAATADTADALLVTTDIAHGEPVRLAGHFVAALGLGLKDLPGSGVGMEDVVRYVHHVDVKVGGHWRQEGRARGEYRDGRLHPETSDCGLKA